MPSPPSSGDRSIDTAQTRVTWNVNITTVIAILGALGSGAYFVATAKTGLMAAKEDNARLEVLITGLRSDFKEGVAELRGQITGLPDLRANMGNVQQQLTDASRWRAEMEKRIADDHDLTLRNRADLDALINPSVSLRSPRPPR